MTTHAPVGPLVEQSIVDEVNLARMRPRDYAAFVHSTLLRTQQTQFQGHDELFNILRNRTPIVGLRASKGLSAVARKRADAVAKGMQSHEPGLDVAERVARYGVVEDQSSLKEVVWMGRFGSDVRKAVLAMLVDDSNPTRSRRTSLLSSTATTCGVACVGNVVCLVLCKAFSEGPPRNPDPIYAPRGLTAKPEEPAQQLPVRQVMTPMHQAPESNKYASSGTPRLHEYGDIRRIINTMPGYARGASNNAAPTTAAAAAAAAAASAVATGGATPTTAAGTPAAVSSSHLPRHFPPPVTPAQAERQRERNPARDYPAVKPAAPVPPPAAAAAAVAAAPARATAEPVAHGGYSGVIIGLEQVVTTLSQGTGESNYVGYNTTLQERIMRWVQDTRPPVAAEKVVRTHRERE